MQKGCDGNVSIEKLSASQLAVVPNKYLLMQTQGTIHKETGERYCETIYILKNQYEDSIGVQLPKYLVSIDYLGIQYPSGRIVLKKVRSVKIDYGHKQSIFYLKK